MSTARSLASCTAAALMLAGCASLRVRMPESRDWSPARTAVERRDGSPSGGLLAGAARVDITPPPGYPMAGYSWIGRVARGYWLRLYARALFFEDTNGHRLALVSNDLWSLPRGLHSRVAELLAEDPALAALLGGRRIDRDEIVLAATHTHQGPAGYSTDRMFSVFAGPRSGFDAELFEFLARRIATAIARAASSARPSTVRYAVTRADCVMRNRSFDAFTKNPDAADIIASNVSDVSLCDDPGYASDACRAVDPTLRMLRVEDVRGGPPIAVALFLAAHPTTIDHRSPLYSSDVFGALALEIERSLGSIRGRGGAGGLAGGSGRSSAGDDVAPVVAIFNGPEGDVSFRWRSQERAELVRLKDLLAARVEPFADIRRTDISKSAAEPAEAAASADVAPSCEARAQAVAPPAERALGDSAVSSSFDVFSLAHQRVLTDDGRWARTARLGMPGRATMIGAEDGRSTVPYCISHEGKRGIDCGPHGRKIGAFDLAEIGGFVIPPVWPSRIVAFVLAPEREVALSVHRLGPLVFATLPGEFTTALGRRIRTSLAQASHAATDDVILIGLAQSYAYYFAAPEEYDEQHYEGSGTLYGRYAGRLIEARLAHLASAGTTTDRPRRARREKYSAGLARTFGPSWIEARADQDEKELDYVLGSSARDDGRLARWCWIEKVHGLGDFSATIDRVTPRVWIETRSGTGWQPLLLAGSAEDDEGLDLVTIAGKPRRGDLCWCAYWTAPPALGRGGEYRFAVTRSGESRACAEPGVCSPAFSPAAGMPAATCPGRGG